MNVPLKFTNHRIEEYALRVTYRPEENAGTIIYNLSLIESRDLEFALSVMKEAHRAGITVSDRSWSPARVSRSTATPCRTAGTPSAPYAASPSTPSSSGAASR